MPWFDRLQAAAYTSSEGSRTEFSYEDVSLFFNKKTSAFDFPDANGTYVQDNGNTGRKFPLRIFFWGTDYDLEATAFTGLLQDSGIGKLEHPIYGTVDVIPFGTIRRRDDLKTAANQAIFDVTFWETIRLIYPISQNDPASDINDSVDQYNQSASNDYNNASTNTTGPVPTSLAATQIQTQQNGVNENLRTQYQVQFNFTVSTLQPIADTQDDVANEFNAIADSIESSLSSLVNTPNVLASQTTFLIQTPALAQTDISDRLNAYTSLIDRIVSGPDAISQPSFNLKSSDDFHTKDLFASTFITGSIVSVINHQFTTKTEALEAAEVLLQQLDVVNAWREANFNSLGEIDTGSTYQALLEAVVITARFLVELSFQLQQERSIILDRNRTIIDLVAELYGSVDENLDLIINSNDLSGDEILELQKGRTIVYYT